MSLYTPLQSYLADRNESSVVMTYPQIEALIGRKLPPTAYGEHRRQWWANTETHSQALAWLRANRKTKLDAVLDRVTFILANDARQAAGTQESGLRGLQPAARRLVEDVAEELNLSFDAAIAELLNRAAMRRRQTTLDWFAANTLHSTTSAAELIRADRDAR
jgi:hypothetical protein